MDAATRYGATGQFMKGTGRMIKLMAVEGLFMLMVISMMDSGRTIKLMALASIPIQMVPSTKATGLMISNTAKEKIMSQESKRNRDR